MTTYSDRELCIANDEGVIEDGFYDLLVAQDRMREIGEGEIQYRDLYDEDGEWIEEESGDEEAEEAEEVESEDDDEE